MSRRIHLRAPGVKTGSTIGPLGPFRGTLGISWVIGSIAVGLLLLLAGTFFLVRGPEPEPPFQAVGPLDSFVAGQPREVVGGVFMGRIGDGDPVAVAEPVNCPLEVDGDTYLDCLGLPYDLTGAPLRRGDPLPLLPVKVHRGQVYVDPTGRSS
jgi:hypothetical protein